MPKQVTITPEVRAVLERGAWKGWLYVLPEGQLEKPLYQAVNKVLVALGGKWTRQHGGHMFSLDAKPAFVAALESGVAVDQKRTAEQFFTPPAIAAEVFERGCVLPRHHVLEPSAGAGALLAGPIAAGCMITAVEQDDALIPALRALLEPVPDSAISLADFLSLTPAHRPRARRPVDRILMNPPFGGGADMAHVAHALNFLEGEGVLVAVMSPHWTFAEGKAAQEFRGLVNDHSHDWTRLPAGSFKSSGTNVNTGILTIRKGTI